MDDIEITACFICSNLEDVISDAETDSENINWKTKLKFCLPELDWKYSYALCKKCAEQLDMICIFRNKCLLSYLQNRDINSDDIQSKCKLCLKDFCTRSDLIAHNLNTHNLEDPYDCLLCSYSFHNQEELIKHENKHYTLQKLFCDECKTTYLDNKQFSEHSIFKHGTVKDWVFNCTNCGLNFPNKIYLQKHKYCIHNSHVAIEFTCYNCGLKFLEKDALIEHIKEVHESNICLTDFMCLSCSSVFNTRKKLEIHKSCCTEKNLLSTNNNCLNEQNEVSRVNVIYNAHNVVGYTTQDVRKNKNENLQEKLLILRKNENHGKSINDESYLYHESKIHNTIIKQSDDKDSSRIKQKDVENVYPIYKSPQESNIRNRTIKKNLHGQVVSRYTMIKQNVNGFFLTQFQKNGTITAGNDSTYSFHQQNKVNPINSSSVNEFEQLKTQQDCVVKTMCESANVNPKFRQHYKTHNNYNDETITDCLCLNYKFQHDHLKTIKSNLDIQQLTATSSIDDNNIHSTLSIPEVHEVRNTIHSSCAVEHQQQSDNRIANSDLSTKCQHSDIMKLGNANTNQSNHVKKSDLHFAREHDIEVRNKDVSYLNLNVQQIEVRNTNKNSHLNINIQQQNEVKSIIENIYANLNHQENDGIEVRNGNGEFYMNIHQQDEIENANETSHTKLIIQQKHDVTNVGNSLYENLNSPQQNEFRNINKNMQQLNEVGNSNVTLNNKLITNNDSSYSTLNPQEECDDEHIKTSSDLNIDIQLRQHSEVKIINDMSYITVDKSLCSIPDIQVICKDGIRRDSSYSTNDHEEVTGVGMQEDSVTRIKRFRKAKAKSVQLKETIEIVHLKESVKKTKMKEKNECDICGINFSARYLLTRHVRNVHATEKVHKCDECEQKFASSVYLAAHKKYHSGNRPHICSFCGKGYITTSDLYHHEKIHANKRAYKCEKCPKAFNTSSDLHKHKICVHLDRSLWKYVCSYCERRFPLKTNLDTHVKTHTGERNYACHLCDRKCINQSVLQRHIDSHSNVCLFRCSHCGQDYKHKKSLNLHLAKMHGIGDLKVPEPVRKFFCSFCPRAYFANNKLQKHIRTHTGERPFSCKICSKTFIDKSYVKQHMKTTHNITD